jgi:hypothetical protein
MEKQTYKIGQTFKPGKNNRNENLTSVKITDIREDEKGWGTKYKMTWYMVTEMNDGSYKKSQRSTWFRGETSITMYIEQSWITL